MLNAITLYLGDNGRCFCGSMRCAGASAHMTGLDLSGQRVMAITPDILRDEPTARFLKCESCGRVSSLIMPPYSVRKALRERTLAVGRTR